MDGRTSSLDFASDRAWMAAGSCFEFSWREETSSSGNAPLVVKATRASPRAPGASFELILEGPLGRGGSWRGETAREGLNGETQLQMPD